MKVQTRDLHIMLFSALLQMPLHTSIVFESAKSVVMSLMADISCFRCFPRAW